MFNTQQEIFFGIILLSLFLLMLVSIIIITAFLYHHRKKKHQLEISNFQNILLQSQLEIQEQTFKAISQEIHDNIGQALSLAKLTLGTIEAAEESPYMEKIINSKNIIGNVLRDLRDISRSLNTDHIFSIGLVQAIEEEVRLLDRSGSLKARIDVSGYVVRLDKQKELILFRIVQEALHNVMKHANASLVTIELEFDGHLLIISINDNGKGFDMDGSNGTGSGLRNMQERTKLVGATWHMGSEAGQGTLIRLSVPLPKLRQTELTN